MVSMTNDRLRSDAALANRDEDKLGYKEFAADLAGLIQNDVPQGGFVVSINGPWGSGKSTVLNFITSELSDMDDSPTIVRFNPWWFSGEADLIQRYFEELAAAVGEGEQYSELRNKLADYANAVSKVPFDAAGVPINKVAGGAAGLIRAEDTSTSELKSSIETTIRDDHDHIVVLIDEIDRLTNRETSQVFKLVKSVADFPNTTYVLAFSKEVVTDALEADENPHRVENGAEYLDKIVQLPHHVPVPKRGSLRTMFETELRQLASEDTTVDAGRATVIINNISKLVDTPRDVTRLLNSIQSSYRILGKEINFLDIVTLEALNEHAEPVYQKIRSEPGSFAFLLRNSRSSLSQEFEDELDENLSEPVEKLISLTFPHWKEDRYVMTDEAELEYREADRVAHPDRLHHYLRKTIPEGQYGSTEIINIIRSTGDEEQFTSKLREEFLGCDREPIENRTLLSELIASRNRVQDPEVVLRGIFNVADELIRLDDRPHSTYETNTTTYLLYLYRYAANNLSSDQTCKIEEAIKEGESLYFPQYILNSEEDDDADVDIRHSQHTPESDTILETLLDMAKEKEEANKLVEVPHLWKVMDLLESDREFVSDWLEDIVTDEDRLVKFLVGFTLTGRINGEPVHYIDPTEFEEYVDLDSVQSSVSSLTLSELNERQQRSVRSFQVAIEIIEEDNDPGLLENWRRTL